MASQSTFIWIWPFWEAKKSRYFCAVAEHRSFTTAARQLNVSQSGVSGQVRDLEKEIGVSLFRRNQREVTLTPEGTVFFHEAREILIQSIKLGIYRPPAL